jgi:integrase
MARTVKDANLQSRDARRRLKPQGKPYYRVIDGGSLHIGYRKPRSGSGKWVMRRYLGEQQYAVEVIGIADDVSDCNDATVLSFEQAQRKARELRDQRDRTAAGKSGPFTVGDAMDLYLEFLEGNDRSEAALADTRYRDKAFIRPALGDVEAAKLTTQMLRIWRDGLAKASPRLRTRQGEVQRYRKAPAGDDAKRARRATARRIWTTLKAALNHAFRAEKIESDAAWKKVEPLPSVDKARVRYLSIAEAKRLINAADAEFRPMIEAGLLTGGRYGQLAALTVGDFNADAGTLTMRTRKGKGGGVKTYHVHLTAEAVAFFKAACARRGGADELIFQKAGDAWKKSHQMKPIKEASMRAKISPPVNFHVTRHTWASHAVMNGMNLMTVAQNLGHRDTKMVELHYGHLAPGYRQSQVREFAPTFGLKASNVVKI